MTIVFIYIYIYNICNVSTIKIKASSSYQISAISDILVKFKFSQQSVNIEITISQLL